MSKAGAAILLKSSSLFGHLPAQAQQQLVDIGYTKSIHEGEILYLQGDPGDRLYLIVSGEARISANSADGRELHLNTLGAGEIMGEIALLDGEARTATATMMSDGMVFCIDRSDLLHYLTEHPSVTVHLMELLCRRVRWMSALLEDSAFLSTEARIAKRILLLAQAAGRESEDGVEVRLSQADLARYLNLTRQAVNQFLQQLQNDGAIRIGRGRLLITDLEKLLARAV